MQKCQAKFALLEFSVYNPRALFRTSLSNSIDFLNSAPGVIYRKLQYILPRPPSCNVPFVSSGGFPADNSIAARTNNHFLQAYVGAIRDLRISDDTPAVNFMMAEGANIVDHEQEIS